MDSPYSPLEFRLLNDWQRHLPLVPTPFAAMAAKLEVAESSVMLALKRLSGKGAISRIGAVFAPWRIGVSTLAAMAAPADRLEEIAAQISARSEINHNYQREHHFNLWFVATAADEAALAEALAGISSEAGQPVISLPLIEQYHIDLGFDLCDAAKQRSEAGSFRREPLDEADRRLVAALQPGLPLVERPFAVIAEQAGSTEAHVLARLQCWLDAGIVKRFGIVVHHRELGFKANAMVVFDVADDRVAEMGAKLSAEAGVTLCYRRRRALPEWPYNLFCMVHGKSREEVAPVIERLRAQTGQAGEVLFSLRRFKQQGARYFDGR